MPYIHCCVLLKITIMQKYIKLTWNGGRTLTLKWEDYLKNEEYWSKQQCKSEIYFEKV